MNADKITEVVNVKETFSIPAKHLMSLTGFMH